MNSLHGPTQAPGDLGRPVRLVVAQLDRLARTRRQLLQAPPQMPHGLLGKAQLRRSLDAERLDDFGRQMFPRGRRLLDQLQAIVQTQARKFVPR